jgi:hypothetical protein
MGLFAQEVTEGTEKASDPRVNHGIHRTHRKRAGYFFCVFGVFRGASLPWSGVRTAVSFCETESVGLSDRL